MITLLAYIFYFIAASASPLQRRWLAVKRPADAHGQIDFAFRVSFIVAVLSLLIPLFSHFQLKGNPIPLILGTTFCAIFGAIFFITSFISQKHVEAGVNTLVSNIYTPITIVLATLLLGEKLTPLQILGTVILLFAVVLVSKKHRIGKFGFDKYFILAVLSGCALGVLLTAERYLQKITGFAAGTMLSWWSQCIALGITTALTGSRTNYSLSDTLTTGLFRFPQSLSWVMLTFIVANLSIVSAITTFKVVIVFLAGAIILKEKDDLGRKIFGSIIAVIGLLLMR